MFVLWGGELGGDVTRAPKAIEIKRVRIYTITTPQMYYIDEA